MAILITGASAGFGKAMCRRFAEAGYHVIGAARRTDKLEALQAELGERFYPLQMDVSDQASVDAALQSLPEPFAEIDALINNAGLALGLEPAGQADFADWLTMINTEYYRAHLSDPASAAAKWWRARAAISSIWALLPALILIRAAMYMARARLMCANSA